VQLSLHESYCLPLLTYAAGAVSYNQGQVHDLNVCWNTVYRIVFNFNRWESVKSFIDGLGKLSVMLHWQAPSAILTKFCVADGFLSPFS